MNNRTCSADNCDRPADYVERALCKKHYQRLRKTGRLDRPGVDERFWSKVDKTTSPDGCWLWTGTATRGYGIFYPARGAPRYAHRYAHETLIGPIPQGFQVDHTCHTPTTCPHRDGNCPHRRCVNPEHLEAVTPRVNGRRSGSFAGERSRQTHCINGHEFTPENTYIKANGCRNCVTCRTASDRRRRAKRAA